MSNSHIEIYQVENGNTEISVRLENETVWLSQNQMVDLFLRDKSVISRHISNIFKEGELDKQSVVAKNATTAADGKDLYPSVEEKAANLLYFITKNHSFTDGNKRIAAFLFLYFLERNGILFDRFGKKRIADNALVALTLMIAVSKPEEKDIMIKVIVNLINKKN
jgi:prophage maintenance system killer protein